jgi:acetyl esterase/lipase
LRPGWSWRVELTAAAMRAILMRSKRRGVPWLRRAAAMQPAPRAILRRVRSEDVDAHGVRARWLVPIEAPQTERVLIYFHGGGFVMGSLESHADVMARLAVQAGARVLGVDYRLAPEHRFPAAHDDCLSATRWVYAQGFDPAHVALGGDSAGGNLAVATLCALRDAGERLPAAGLLLCPWVDPLAAGGSMESNADADFGDRELLVAWANDYLPRGSPREPRAFPIEAKLTGLPALLVQVGGAELLRDQVLCFAERARDAGVELRLELAPDMFHDWQLQAQLLPDGARAIAQAACWLAERL